MSRPPRFGPLIIALMAVVGLTGCVDAISEPWVSGEWGQRLEDERTRTYEQQQRLRERLEGYAEPYR